MNNEFLKLSMINIDWSADVGYSELMGVREDRMVGCTPKSSTISYVKMNCKVT